MLQLTLGPELSEFVHEFIIYTTSSPLMSGLVAGGDILLAFQLCARHREEALASGQVDVLEKRLALRCCKPSEVPAKQVVVCRSSPFLCFIR